MSMSDVSNSNGFVKDAALKVWNYQCFESPRKERNAIITLLVVGLLALVISILAKSRGLGIISGASLLVGIAMLVRKIYRLREESDMASTQRISISEITHALFEIDEETNISAPKQLVDALGKAKTEKIKIFEQHEAPISKKDMESISPLVRDNIPALCHGKFKNGFDFILIKLKQAKQDQPFVYANNFLLFTGNKEASTWVSFDTTNIPDTWDIYFEMTRKDDMVHLAQIMTDGEGKLRGPNNIEWKIVLSTKQV